VPSLERSSPAYLLEAGGRQYLIDCGSGTLHQLMRAGTSCYYLDSIFITHTHPDHIGDLIPIIHALKLPTTFRRKAPLRLFGPPGFTDFYDRCVDPVASRPKNYTVEVMEAEVQFEHHSLSVTTGATVHSDSFQSIAYRFEKDGKAFVFSGDCDYDSGIVALANGAEVLVIDCSTTNASKTAGHLSSGECGRIAEEANVKILVLSHLYPVVGTEDTRLSEARALCQADVRLAEDLMQIES